MPAKVEFGDWQTPEPLARAVVEVASRFVDAPATVVEPTCGEGAFLRAARDGWPAAQVLGFEVNRRYAAAARRAVAGDAKVRVADFFEVGWKRTLAASRGPILVLGNPPWVTSATLGKTNATNHPPKRNFKKLRGVDARTGKGNFDVSEWMILHLLDALRGTPAALAMLCKSAVARRVIEHVAREGWDVRPGGLFRVDAAKHFEVAVDAVLFVCTTAASQREENAVARWPVHSSLDAAVPTSFVSFVDGVLVADLDAYRGSARLAGVSSPEWRSGLKHDCARVMELSHDGDAWKNGLGERVVIEEAFVFPMLKGSDLANGRLEPRRRVIVPQATLGQDTSGLRTRAPSAWAYLTAHGALLEARKSSIYRGRPAFSIFGVGEYAFAPWKVAISGLYKRLAFEVIGPYGGRPVLFDDTCYFLPFDTEVDARRAARVLASPSAREFFEARIFWDAKRPITKGVLQTLDLARLLRELVAG